MTVSVIVPVYNGSRFLEGCISALEAQTYRDFEALFVVDSKTDDDSAEIIRSNSGRLPSVRVIIQNDGDRVSGARNIGISEATGDLIWFLDVDDWPYPDFLSELVRIQSETGADMVFCNHIQLMERKVPEQPEGEYRVSVESGADAVAEFTRYPVYPWSRIQRRSIFDDGRALFHNHLTAEDIEQTIRSLALSEKVAYYNRPLYVYYKVEGSFSHNNRSREAEAINEIGRRSLDFVSEVRPESYDRFKVHMLERVMRQMSFAPYGEFKKAYASSVAHEILGTVGDRTMEMNVFSRSKLLYYIALLPFTHWLWDGRTGLWDKGA